MSITVPLPREGLSGHSQRRSGHTVKLFRLPRSFYRRPTLTVARELLGKYLVRRFGNTLLVARIVEVEAYRGSSDPASHAYNGPTERNKVMFGDAGHLYVYFTYGMHFCCNVVTARAGRGEAVLLRGLEPVSGVKTMTLLRGVDGRGRISVSHVREGTIHELCNGPGKICQAFGLGRGENGADLCGTTIWLARDLSAPPRIGRSTRVGIRNGLEHRWRFYIPQHPSVSKGKPSG
jgi:DNA-3-methyladenine glycosylase